MNCHRLLFVTSALSYLFTVMMGCQTQNSSTPTSMSTPVTIDQPDMAKLHEKLSARIISTNAEALAGPGLVGALGGAHLKLLRAGDHEVLLPLPQLVPGQIPICYFVRSQPPEAVAAYRIQRREELNDVISVKLTGKRNQEIQLEWSSVVLLLGENAVGDESSLPEAYRSATACVQADSANIQELAEKLWPQSEKVEDYARNIQRFIREMTRVQQPRSLDALGILNSGVNGVCTANANLALALLRAKGISGRSMAVIPPTAQRLEMHRIVEYYHDERRHYFDPSSVHVDIPMQPWQTLIMARTSIADEQIAMKPRMGTSLGCPYGQEMELLDPGITFWGQEFFWTTAKPLEQVELQEEAISRAIADWSRYLQAGTLSDAQLRAAAKP